ncbi:MAG: hypothetical protein KDA52_00905 [Planctomycetaceae bacterium]|nr:hypothetical protein [Planctomycetaceae bacterium]
MPKRQIVTGYTVSATLHLSLIVGAIVLSVPAWPALETSTISVRTVVSDRPVIEDGERLAGQIDEIESPPVVEESQPSTHDVAVDRTPTATAPGLAEFARRRLDFARREADDQSPAQQQADLETLGRRLQNVGSEESVAELSGTLNKWLGAEDRATQADPEVNKNKTTVPFDATTAQISDVKKIESEGSVTYVAILVDASGQSTEAKLDEIDGQQLYETFQIIKKFPLLETVYRRTVMGLLDKLTRESSPEAESPAPPASGSSPQGGGE